MSCTLTRGMAKIMLRDDLSYVDDQSFGVMGQIETFCSLQEVSGFVPPSLSSSPLIRC